MHPSLKATEKGKKQKSVLKRIERIKSMLDKEKWKEGDDFYHLPKLKTVRIKIKKEKVEKAAEGVTAEAAAVAPAGTGKAAPAAAPAKAAPAKETKEAKK
jgi:small basic protein (TIGR04137 family)